MTVVGFQKHDHARCVRSGLAAAEAECRVRKLRLTPVRRRALELLLSEHRALGAYDLLARLSDEGLGSQPPVAYRALDFLVKAGFAHKIEALNAYLACAHLGDDARVPDLPVLPLGRRNRHRSDAGTARCRRRSSRVPHRTHCGRSAGPLPCLPGPRRVSLLAARGLTLRREGRLILENVDFAITKGEIVTIVGPNGSGKSSLLRALIGALEPDTGKVERMPGLRIGYVPQKLHIDPTLPLTVRRFLNLPRRWPRAAVSEALAQAGAAHLAQRQMTALSRGQFQRILLARALLGKPDLLILDEATQGLDQPGAAAFYRQIEDLRQTLGCAVLMVSHDLHVVMAASDRVLCLNGHVCCEGTPEVVADAPEYRALFGSGTQGALALYRHDHHHSHDHGAEPHP